MTFSKSKLPGSGGDIAGVAVGSSSGSFGKEICGSGSGAKMCSGVGSRSCVRSFSGGPVTSAVKCNRCHVPSKVTAHQQSIGIST